MNNDSPNVEISVQELKLLVNTLTKSVALSLGKRHSWLAVLVGLLIGSCITIAIISLTWKHTDKITATTETLLEKSKETMSELQQINSNVNRLALAVNALNAKKQKNQKPATPPDVEKTRLNETQGMIQPGRYTVYLHYTNKKNKKLMEKFSVFLNNNGFKVAGIQRVIYQNQDVRYFHDEDKTGALLLKKLLTGFITPFTNIKDADIKIKDLSLKYPNAQKGALELWVNF